MAFFTRYCKKTSALLRLSMCISLCLGLLCAPALALAADSSMVIKSADLQLQDEHYVLNAEMDIIFDEAIEAAINKGVALNFVIEFQVVSPRKYWFDDEIVTTSSNVSLSYHALSRQYLVARGAHQKSFETLSEAKEELAQLADWRVFDKSLIEKSSVYNAALLVRLDQTKLPKAIQVDAIGSEKWNLISQKFVWSLKDLANKEPKP
jgi:Domain of unknown function (DUF4390)